MSKLTDDIKANFGGSTGEANKAVESVVAAVIRTLKADGKVALPGLGTLKLTAGGETKEGRNPQTGATTSYVTKPKVAVKLGSDALAQLG